MSIELLEFKPGFSLSSGRFDVGDPRAIASLLLSHRDAIKVLPEGRYSLPLPTGDSSVTREVVVYEEDGIYRERSTNSTGKIIKEIPISKGNPTVMIFGQGADDSIASIYYILTYSPSKTSR